MTKRQLASIESKITRAVKKARAAGFRVTRGEFYRLGDGRRKPRCCPIEALCPGIGREEGVGRAAQVLDVTRTEVWCFIAGVDDSASDRPGAEGDDQQMWDLGDRLRRELRIR